MSDREEFLAGKRPSDIHIFLHDDSVSNAEALKAHGEVVENGIVLLMDGDQAREVFQQATGIDPMALAQEAMKRDGEVSEECTDATCPDGEDHIPKFIFSFAEEQNEEVGGLYADGPVIHAYVACDCGTRYSDKWVIDE
jgi:hypothetical protein